ncbi:salutaridine reductase-like [Magnolia sinica]|uniref:salutaridine reductase-like n=1 Tax=Magnolia sinica TaxID=86752 RepID=UPI00265ACDEF|nr:salutaridine reductase-like [Magnolia sinica]
MEGANISNPAEKRCAVVTGANKGIGLEIIRQLASNGITVILTARDEKRGLEAVANIKESGPSDVVFHQLDVKDSVSIASLANFVKTQFGKLDILVNNAGIHGLVIDSDGVTALRLLGGEMDEEKMKIARGLWQETYEMAEECLKTNYYGSKSVTEALFPLLHLSKSPRIVNVSSMGGKLELIPNEKFKEEVNHVDGLTEERLDEWLQSYLKDFKEERLDKHGWPTTTSAYIISKAALNAYTRILAKKFPTFCINSVHPGAVKTDMNHLWWTETLEEGAHGPVMLALLPDGGPSGHFFDQMKMSTY